jgi:ABC-type sugar transport system ATPase subunit
MPSASALSPILTLRGIGKSYGAVVALDGVDLDLSSGEVLAICGDNGAGKSTLIKIVSGAQEPSVGTLTLRGETVRLRSPHDALAKGIATIYQDLALAPRLSIAENVFMGAELTRPLGLPFLRILDKARMATEARGYLSRLSVAIEDMRRPVERLSGGQRQAVAISRALRWNAEVIIMDEPTAALGPAETGAVEEVIAGLRDRGFAVLIISHNLEQVFRLVDRVWVLRRGQMIGDRWLSSSSPEEIVAMITGATSVVRGQGGIG